jgi:hypothetical protein
MTLAHPRSESPCPLALMPHQAHQGCLLILGPLPKVGVVLVLGRSLEELRHWLQRPSYTQLALKIIELDKKPPIPRGSDATARHRNLHALGLLDFQ